MTRALAGRTVAAKEMEAAWRPTKGRKPEKKDPLLIDQALSDCWFKPTVMADARFFRPIGTERSGHTGCSVTHSATLVDRSDFQDFWQPLLKRIRDAHAGGYHPVNIAVYCRAGEKRSVSIAWLLSASLKRRQWVELEPVRHLCSMFWRRKTCNLQDCHECDVSSDQHRELVDRLSMSLPEDF